MNFQYAGDQVKTMAQVEARQLDIQEKKRDSIKLVQETQTKLFCYRASYRAVSPQYCETNLYDRIDQWCNRGQTLAFLEKLRQAQSTAGRAGKSQPYEANFTLILDRDLFEQIMTAFRMPDRAREVICSIHGVFARFVEHEGDARRSLLIILSTPKSPIREVFCAMRIVPELASVTCLLFDAKHADLCHVIDLLRSSPPGLAWRSPVAFLAMLVRECGRTSELKRRDLDGDIITAECQTESTSWKRPEDIPGREKTQVRWLNDFYAMTNAMHLCHNEMMFVARAVDFELCVWNQLRRLMMTDDPELKPWLRASAGTSEWISIKDDVLFEISHTVDRSAQIKCLKERIVVQVNLIDNIIARQENSQTNLIAILALIFAPASLVASIFSAGIFATNKSSWITYIATTVPVTLITVIAGLSFIKQRKIKRAWRALQGSTTP